MSAYIPTLGTILVAIFTAIFGIYSYQRQKRVDSQNYVEQKKIDRDIELRNQRMKEYERYITAYQKHTSLYDVAPPPADNSKTVIESRTEYWVAYSNLFQIASDPVVTAASDFHKYWWGEYDPTNKENQKIFGALYAKLIIAMRADVSERTKLSPAELEKRIPFDFTTGQSEESEATRGEQPE